MELFSTLHPRTHPVLWRMLVVQAHFHRAIGRTFGEVQGVIVRPTETFTSDERKAFDWREESSPETEDDALEADFRAAESYVTTVLDNP